MPRSRAALSNPERGEVTKARILDAARQLIARHGGRGISLTDVANAASVSKTGLMHHFKTKEALLAAVLDAQDEIDGYPELWPPTVGVDFVDLMVETVRDWANNPSNRGVFLALLMENLGEDDPFHERLVKRSRDVLARIRQSLEQGKKVGTVRESLDVAAAAADTLIFLNGLETYLLFDQEISIVELAESWRVSRLNEWGPRTDPSGPVPVFSPNSLRPRP